MTPSLPDVQWFDMPHITGFYVYALFGDDPNVPLYVGQSTSLLGRLGSHLSDAERRTEIRRIAVTPCGSRPEMYLLERTLIEQLRPIWNVAYLADRRGTGRRKRTSIEIPQATRPETGIQIRRDQLAEACNRSGFRTVPELASAMGLTETAVSRTLSAKRQVGPDFIAGLKGAFPNRHIDDLLIFEDQQVSA